MNQPVLVSELITAVPLMDRRAKLLRLASLIRQCGHQVYIFNGIEFASPNELAVMEHPSSAFSLAAQDHILQDAGLQNNSAGEAKRFFGLSREDLHSFSCDCGGHISNEQMARRVEALASA